MTTKRQELISNAFGIMLRETKDPFVAAERVLREGGITEEVPLNKIFRRILMPKWDEHNAGSASELL